MVVRRLFYLLYYLREMRAEKFWKFESYARNQTGMPRIRMWFDMVRAAVIHNVSLLDYFYFRFYLPSTDRTRFAGTGFMYEYQLKMNPAPHRRVLANKLRFAEMFKEFIHRGIVSYEKLVSDPAARHLWWHHAPPRLVAKYSLGQVGAEVRVINKSDFTEESFLSFLRDNRYDMVEDFVEQHPELKQLSAAGLNTVRVITQVNSGEVQILAARLRITVNSSVDNMAAGNLAAPVDVESGVVAGPGVYSDITKDDEAVHPVTGQSIEGFQIPRWSDVVSLAKRAALTYPANRSVGWDIAISAEDVQLIEGNHNWCKLLWQLPVKNGLKHELASNL